MRKLISNAFNRWGKAANPLNCVPLLLLPLMLVCSLPAYAEYSFQLIVPPGATGAQVFGINNAGIITGTSDLGGYFTYNMKSGQYTQFDGDYSAIEISNSGMTVGDVFGVCAIRSKDGVVTEFYPPSWTPGSFCQARGVNPDGKVSGFMIDEFHNWLGFIYDSEYGTYEEFLPSPQTLTQGINAQGQNVGSVFLFDSELFPGSPQGRYGYLRQVDGAVKYFAIAQSWPGFSRARGISENGLMAGFYVDALTFEFKSYVTTVPESDEFEVIWLADDEVVHQVPCNPDTPPPPTGYTAYADIVTAQVRNDGVIVGSCTDYQYNWGTGDLIVYPSHGFVGTPAK